MDIDYISFNDRDNEVLANLLLELKTATENNAISSDTLDVINALSDGEENTDIELCLSDIKSMLMYDEENTALYELSSRLELIDARLDTEFMVLNEFYGFVGCALLTVLSIKFFSWLTNTFSP